MQNVKGVPFVNRRSTKGWTSGQSLPVKKQKTKQNKTKKNNNNKKTHFVQYPSGANTCTSEKYICVYVYICNTILGHIEVDIQSWFLSQILQEILFRFTQKLIKWVAAVLDPQ